MGVDLLSKAFFKTASFWPAHSGCISLDALLMVILVMMCEALGFSTGSYRCFLLRNVYMLLSSTPLSISPLCDGYIYFRLCKVSVMVLCNDRLLCTCFSPQQGWSFPVVGCLLNSSGYGLLNCQFCYETYRGFLVISAALVWLSGHKVWFSEVEVAVHRYTGGSVVNCCGFISGHLYAIHRAIVMDYYCNLFLGWTISVVFFTFSKVFMLSLIKITVCYLSCFQPLVGPCCEVLFSLWGLVCPRWQRCSGDRCLGVSALTFHSYSLSLAKYLALRV